eukprot:2894280-Amphidinium_carterae.1
MRLRMDQLLRPRVPDKIEQTVGAIETWEREVREYELRYKKALDKEVRLATLLSLYSTRTRSPTCVLERSKLH